MDNQRPLTEWLQIIGELATAFQAARTAAAADGKISITEILAFADQGLSILLTHKVTIQEIQAFLKTAQPLLDLLHVR